MLIRKVSVFLHATFHTQNVVANLKKTENTNGMSLNVIQIEDDYGIPFRSLTVADRFNQGTFRVVEKILEEKIPNHIKSFLRVYGNSRVIENIFIDDNGNELEFAQFSSNTDFMGLPKEFKDAGWGKWLIFGHDPGGWHYCMSFDDKRESGIYINRWNDNRSDSEQFLKISDSFKDFINGLTLKTENH